MLLAGRGGGWREGWGRLRKWRAYGEIERRRRERESERGWAQGDKRERETSVGKGLAVVICGEPR